ncbi:unnamed protein product [Phyllotreta striolata]|uniref:Uncharacterized protein n=1 Tax=Phyllotreta striolata TaxID=444603 RepID=A0A9N9TFJ9_PHYSR|nr:unnamed protein product [Phyllotreta striolata]
MEPKIYCGASSHHVHCENYNFEPGKALKLFGNENPDERTTWVDLRNCTGTLDSTSLSLLPALDYLNITDSSVELSPKVFSSMPKLRALTIGNNSKTTIRKEFFEECAVQNLTIEDSQIPTGDCFAHLKSLDNLTLKNCTLEKFNDETVSNLHLLKYLYIDKCQIGSLGDFHEHVPQLEYLYISENKMQQFDYEGIAKLEKLNTLGMYANEVGTDINYEVFQKLPKLETISFDTAVYKNLKFTEYPSLKTVHINTPTDVLNDEEQKVMDELEKLNINFEYHYYGPLNIDYSKVLICA